MAFGLGVGFIEGVSKASEFFAGYAGFGMIIMLKAYMVEEINTQRAKNY